MRYFITGTDTGCGKTFVTAGLVRALRAGGRDAVALKPVASGFERVGGRRRNGDLDALDAANQGVVAAADLCVHGFDAAIAPHRAAELEGRTIALEPILAAATRVGARHRDLLIEGVGGYAVPLSASLLLADLVRALGLPLLLVVGLRLGCINHALLSAAAIRADGLVLAGWIGNRVDAAMAQPQASIDAIAARIGAPLLGIVEPGGGGLQALAARLLAADGEPIAPAGVHAVPSARHCA